MSKLDQCLIIENQNGEVYIVEDKERMAQIQKILKSTKPKATRATKIKIEDTEPPPVDVKPFK